MQGAAFTELPYRSSKTNSVVINVFPESFNNGRRLTLTMERRLQVTTALRHTSSQTIITPYYFLKIYVLVERERERTWTGEGKRVGG